MTSTCQCAGGVCNCNCIQSEQSSHEDFPPTSRKQPPPPPLRIAIDFGGVLSKKDHASASASAPSDSASGASKDAVAVAVALPAPAETKGHRSTAIDMPGAVNALAHLSTQGQQLVLLSFCGKTRAQETKKAILDHAQVRHCFRDLFFVKDTLHKKLIVAAAKCNVMVDDTLDILLDMAKSVECKGVVLIWFRPGDDNGDDKDQQQPTERQVALIREHNIHVATSWDKIVTTLDKLTLEQEAAGVFDPDKEGVAIKKRLASRLYAV